MGCMTFGRRWCSRAEGLHLYGLRKEENQKALSPDEAKRKSGAQVFASECQCTDLNKQQILRLRSEPAPARLKPGMTVFGWKVAQEITGEKRAVEFPLRVAEQRSERGSRPRGLSELCGEMLAKTAVPTPQSEFRSGPRLRVAQGIFVAALSRQKRRTPGRLSLLTFCGRCQRK
jgi:hypothetical protein